jgi:hypothetical protein
MSAGRTSWWPKDAAWHRRELIVELGEEFGAEGPAVIDVLCAWAQEQRSRGSSAAGSARSPAKPLSRSVTLNPSSRGRPRSGCSTTSSATRTAVASPAG